MIFEAMAAWLASAAQVEPAEWIAQAELPGFAVAHGEEGANGMITEWVPHGETAQRWTRMVTVQRFTGAARRLRPEDLLGNMISGLRTGCPGARTSEIARLSVSGRPAARFRADCPLNPATRLPETFAVVAVAGAADLHVGQVAFRRVPTDRDMDWGERQLQSVILCSEGSSEAGCNSP